MRENETGRRERIRAVVLFLAATATIVGLAAVSGPRGPADAPTIRVAEATSTATPPTIPGTNPQAGATLRPTEMPGRWLSCPVSWYLGRVQHLR